MERFVLRGAQVLYGGSFGEMDVAVEGGRIAQVGQRLNGDVLRVEGYLLPGLIDEHIHGICGSDAMQGAQAVEAMSRSLVRHGVTSFLPTTMNAGVEETRAAVEGAKEVMRAGSPGAFVAGVHMDGPFLGEKYRGAQDSRANLPPSMENFARLAGGAADVVRLITVAPELPGAQDFIRAATRRGIVVSAGHTDATYEEMEAAVGWGLAQVTHLFNGMNPLHHRAPGVPGAALTLSGLATQVIADGVHLHPAAVRLAVRSGANILLITDSMRATGLEDGVYDLGGQTVYVSGGVARLAAGNLAGSTLTLERAVKNAMRFAEIPLEEAAAMASSRVAASLGLNDRGEIAPGLRADLCLLGQDLEVAKTFVGGKLLFER